MQHLIPPPGRIWLALSSRAPSAGPFARVAIALLLPLVALAWILKACHWTGRAAILAPLVAVGLAVRGIKWLFLLSVGIGLLGLALGKGAEWAAAKFGMEWSVPTPSQRLVRRSPQAPPRTVEPVQAAASLVIAPTPEPAAAARAPAVKRIGRSPAAPDRRKAGREGLLRPGR